MANLTSVEVSGACVSRIVRWSTGDALSVERALMHLSLKLIGVYAHIGKASQKTPLEDLSLSDQPPFVEAVECNCLALRQAARHVSQIYDRHLASEELRTTQFSILSKMSQTGPIVMNELAKMVVMDRTTLGRAVRPLARDRLISIKAGGDARTRTLCLTKKGHDKVAAATERWREAQKEFEDTFGRQPAADLRGVLRRVVSAAST